MKNPVFSTLKALAIILVVVAHASAPEPLVRFAYLVAVPTFFVFAGFVFNPAHCDNKSAFVGGRVRNLYLPFVKWSVFFLLVHNWLFSLGLASEHYGNAAGGVTHPYDWQTAAQQLWNIVFHMSGYDPFLAGAFWFFRTLFVANLAFFALYCGLRRWDKLRQRPYLIGAIIALLALSLAVWQTTDQLKISSIAQGGYRELMATFFMGVGHLWRCAEEGLHYLRKRILALLLGAAVLLLVSNLAYVAMTPKAARLSDVFLLALGGVGAFVFLRSLATFLLRIKGKFSRALVIIGEHSLSIFVFHLLAFKLVSAIKVAVYALPWEAVASHPVVHEPKEPYFWILYVIVGVALPCWVVWRWQSFVAFHAIDLTKPREWGRMLMFLLKALVRNIHWLLNFLVYWTVVFTKGVLVSVKNGRRSLMEHTKDKEDYDDDSVNASHNLEEEYPDTENTTESEEYFHTSPKD